MAQFKHFINQISGLQFVCENVKVCSPLGKTLLMNTPFETDTRRLAEEFDRVARWSDFLQKYPKEESLLVRLLHELNDISQTVENLRKMQTLDDIEFFEVKKFAMASQKIRQLLQNLLPADTLPQDLSAPVRLLDPERSGIAHFYIYATYDERLAPLRKRIEAAADTDEREKLTWECAQIEDFVRRKLSEMLHPYWENLQKNLRQLAIIDLLHAKAQMAAEWQLCQPAVATESTKYEAIFHPQVKQQLSSQGGEFQSVDIELRPAPCLITGANMSGKTVLLKSLALAQYLFQFGFYVPAKSASIVPADKVFCIIDDRQNELHGLSSFAAEVMNINEIIASVKAGERPLVLVDELARTTNPDEGRRIVNAFVSIMAKYNITSLITTHYSGITAQCRRLRVKGLLIDKITDSVTPRNLYRYMDYSLAETSSDEVPAEALNIARIFHADSEFLRLAEEDSCSNEQ